MLGTKWIRPVSTAIKGVCKYSNGRRFVVHRHLDQPTLINPNQFLQIKPGTRSMSASTAVGETNLSVLLKSMKPTLNAGEFVFTTLPTKQFASLNIPRSDTVCEFQEAEGVTLVMEKEKAINFNLKFESIFAWITLEVHSSLDAVGLTAAFSNELARAGISCNVIAGYYHDHIFVGIEDGPKSLETLKGLAAKQP